MLILTEEKKRKENCFKCDGTKRCLRLYALLKMLLVFLLFQDMYYFLKYVLEKIELMLQKYLCVGIIASYHSQDAWKRNTNTGPMNNHFNKMEEKSCSNICTKICKTWEIILCRSRKGLIYHFDLQKRYFLNLRFLRSIYHVTTVVPKIMHTELRQLLT